MRFFKDEIIFGWFRLLLYTKRGKSEFRKLFEIDC